MKYANKIPVTFSTLKRLIKERIEPAPFSNKIKGTPKTITVKIAYRPWVLAPVNGAEYHDAAIYPVWKKSKREYADEVFANIEDAIEWVKEELNETVEEINTQKSYNFVGMEFIKGSGKIVKSGKTGYKVIADYKDAWGDIETDNYILCGGVEEVNFS